MTINTMDIVGRISYHCDILFRVIDIKDQGGKKMAVLFGEDIRLVADAPCEDLIVINRAQRMKFEQEYRSLEEQSFQLFRQDLALLREKQEYEVTDGYSKTLNYFQIPGRVLHLDGDPSYLKKCLSVYEK